MNEPSEPANVPLLVPEYLQQDDDSWDGLPEVSEYDDYLDGRESGLSLGSLWSNQTDFDRVGSSLESWGEDEFDQAASKGVADMFSEIDSCLYEGTELTNNPTMAAECKDWVNKEFIHFPHLRIIGKQMLSSEEKGYKLYPRPARPPSVTLSAKMTKDVDIDRSLERLEITGHTVTPQITPRKTKKKEETLAEHGTFEELIALDYTDVLLPQSDDVNQFVVQKKAMIAEFMNRLWPDIINLILPLLRRRASIQQRSMRDRRHSGFIK